MLDEPSTNPATPPIIDADTGETLVALVAFLTHAALEAATTRPRPGKTPCS